MVFVAFCADWCPFSRRLKPIFEEAAAVFAQENPTANVIWALVDSVEQVKFCWKLTNIFFISVEGTICGKNADFFVKFNVYRQKLRISILSVNIQR